MKEFDKLYINGKWVKSNNTEINEVINPATESPCARVPRGNREDVNAAVASARQAFNGWAHAPAEKRAEIMNAVADEMQRRADDLIDAHVITMGCPRHLTAGIHVDAPIDAMRYYAGRASQMDDVEENIVGDPNDSHVTMGPMASASQKQTVLKYIKTGIAEGARLVTGGIDMPQGLHVGAYVQPTIFADVSNEMVIAKEEIFGPVLCMIVYDDIEGAIEIANDTVFGLSSGVYAKNKASALKIARRIRAGQCYIQGGYFNLEAPFGGYKQSGNGREWGDQAMHEYIETKAIIA